MPIEHLAKQSYKVKQTHIRNTNLGQADEFYVAPRNTTSSFSVIYPYYDI